MNKLYYYIGFLSEVKGFFRFFPEKFIYRLAPEAVHRHVEQQGGGSFFFFLKIF